MSTDLQTFREQVNNKKNEIRAYQNVPHSLRQTEAEYNDLWKECNGWMEGIQANLWTSVEVFLELNEP